MNTTEQMRISENTVSSIVKKHSIPRSLTERGRKKSTTERQDRHLIRNSLNYRRLTSSDLKKLWQDECNVQATTRIDRFRFSNACLRGCVAAKKPLLSAKKRNARL